MEILTDAGAAMGEMVRLLPFLPEALQADVGTGDGQPGSPTKNVHRSLVNGDVLHTITVVQREIPAIDAEARQILGETPHPGDAMAILRPLPGVLRRLEAGGFDDLARDYAFRILRVHRSVRRSLRLDTPDIQLGAEHPDCGGALVLPGREGEAHVRVVDGRVVLDRGADEAVSWGETVGIVCRGCGESWHPSQARWLADAVAA